MHTISKFNTAIVTAIIAILVFSQCAFSQDCYRVKDKDGFANLRKEPNIKSDIILQIPNDKCVFEMHRHGEWSEVIYIKEKEKYYGYIHTSRIKKDASCEETNKYKIVASEIMERINKEGAHKVVKELYEDELKWPMLLKNVASGEKSWLKVAVNLRPGTDADASETLDIAMFMAIENSPESVMRYSTIDCCKQGMFSLVFICSSNFLIDYPLDFESLRIVQRRKEALLNIKSKELYGKRDKCIALLEKVIAEIQKDLKQQAIEKK
jgi:hypothetical protein